MSYKTENKGQRVFIVEGNCSVLTGFTPVKGIQSDAIDNFQDYETEELAEKERKYRILDSLLARVIARWNEDHGNWKANTEKTQRNYYLQLSYANEDDKDNPEITLYYDCYSKSQKLERYFMAELPHINPIRWIIEQFESEGFTKDDLEFLLKA